MVDHAGQAGLARPGLASQQDGRVERSDSPDLFDRALHPIVAGIKERRPITQGLDPGPPILHGGPTDPMSRLDRVQVDQVGEPAQVERPAQAIPHTETEQGQHLLGMMLLGDRQCDDRGPGDGDRLQQLCKARDVNLFFQVNQRDQDPIVIYD